MRVLLTYLRIFALLLAGLIFCAHLVIPHDHHIADSVIDTGIPFDNSHSKTNKDHGFPGHCHAFNDLLAEKVLKLNLNDSLQNVKSDVNLFSGIMIKLHEYQACTVQPGDEIILYSSDHEVASLRAPPSLV
jgi:hypothetical protein